MVELATTVPEGYLGRQHSRRDDRYFVVSPGPQISTVRNFEDFLRRFTLEASVATYVTDPVDTHLSARSREVLVRFVKGSKIQMPAIGDDIVFFEEPR